MRELHSQESRRVRRNRSCHSRRHTREESLEASASIQLLDRARNGRVTLSTLQAALDSVDGEDRDPHGDTGRATGRHDGGNAELARLAVLVLGRQPALDRLVRGEVDGRAGPVARQSHYRSAVDRSDSALFVQLAHDVGAARVFGLLAGAQLFLALQLQEHFHALEGCGDDGHGDGGEEACGTDLGD